MPKRCTRVSIWGQAQGLSTCGVPTGHWRHLLFPQRLPAPILAWGLLSRGTRFSRNGGSVPITSHCVPSRTTRTTKDSYRRMEDILSCRWINKSLMFLKHERLPSSILSVLLSTSTSWTYTRTRAYWRTTRWGTLNTNDCLSMVTTLIWCATILDVTHHWD